MGFGSASMKFARDLLACGKMWHIHSACTRPLELAAKGRVMFGVLPCCYFDFIDHSEIESGLTIRRFE